MQLGLPITRRSVSWTELHDSTTALHIGSMLPTMAIHMSYVQISILDSLAFCAASWTMMLKPTVMTRSIKARVWRYQRT